MFTGIITSTGKIKKIEQNTKNRSAIKVSVDLGKDSKGLKIGQSVALNGVCLSATKIVKNISTFEMIDETMKKTDLGNLKVGSIVNVERSLKVGESVILELVFNTYGVSHTSSGQLSQVCSLPSQVDTGQSSQAVVAKKSQVYSPSSSAKLSAAYPTSKYVFRLNESHM